MTRKQTIGLRIVASLAIIVLVVLFDLIVSPLFDQPASSPDITVTPCSMTHIPAFTRTDICVASDGSIVSH